MSPRGSAQVLGCILIMSTHSTQAGTLPTLWLSQQIRGCINPWPIKKKIIQKKKYELEGLASAIWSLYLTMATHATWIPTVNQIVPHHDLLKSEFVFCLLFLYINNLRESFILFLPLHVKVSCKNQFHLLNEWWIIWWHFCRLDIRNLW